MSPVFADTLRHLVFKAAVAIEHEAVSVSWFRVDLCQAHLFPAPRAGDLWNGRTDVAFRRLFGHRPAPSGGIRCCSRTLIGVGRKVFVSAAVNW
jgi:hypothetical protein